VTSEDDRSGEIEGVNVRMLRLRKERGLTQKDLAGGRYSAAFVSTVESGRRRPSEEAVRYFAERLDVEPSELLTGRPAHLEVELELALAEARHAVSTGELAAAEAAYATVRDQARGNDLPRLTARALEGLARCAERAGDMDSALRRLTEARAALAEEPLPTQVPALVATARIHRARGKLRDAAYLLETALERLERDGLPDPEAVVQLQYGLVGVYADLGLLDRAAAAGEVALSLAGHVDDPEPVAQMHMQVARTFMLQGRWGDAEDSLSRAQATFRRLDYSVESAMCRWARGYVLLREDRLAEAERELSTASQAMRSLDAWYYAGALASELATVLWRLGRPADACAALEDAWRLESAEGSAALLPVADAYRLKGLIARDTGDPETAERALRRAFADFRTAAAGPLAANTARLLGDLLHERGEFMAAVEAYRAGLAAVEEAPV
jgi:tetratricopeptide (TPR) repeat protein